jgi:anti-sigma regulatory factor (Ser/Thr protein kinase)
MLLRSPRNATLKTIQGFTGANRSSRVRTMLLPAVIVDLRDLMREAWSGARAASSGWSTRVLRQSMHRSLLAGVAGWQLVMLWAVLTASIPAVVTIGLALGYAVLCVGALLARAGRLPVVVLVPLCYLVGASGWAASHEIDSVLVFASSWLVNFAAVVGSLAISSPAGVGVVALAAVILPLASIWIEPGWAPVFPASLVVTQLAILIVARAGTAVLSGFSTRVDARTRTTQAEMERFAARRAASREIAEDLRMLHDTVINTLGAVANGGAGVSDPALVRERCAHDIAELSILERSSGSAHRTHRRLSSIFDAPGRVVERTGLDDFGIARVEARLDAATTTRIVWIVGELIQNSMKHARASSIVVDLRASEEELVVAVVDDGIGFDRERAPGRGLAASVFGRARELGAEVTIDSSSERGTSVTIRVPLGAAAHDPVEWAVGVDPVEATRTFRTNAAIGWALGVSAVGIVLETLNRMGVASAAYLMIVLNAIMVAVVHGVRGSSARVRLVVSAMLAIAASAAFVLSAAAVDFGRFDVVLWQALAPSASLVMLISMQPSRRIVVGAFGLFAATVITVTVLAWPIDPSAAAIIPIAGAVSFGFAVCWGVFNATLGTVGEAVASEEEAVLTTRMRTAATTAAASARERWLSVGLRDTLDLLNGIVSGRLDPRDRATQDACRRDETHLRQLIMLDPDLVHLGGTIIRALGESQRRDVRLVVMAGGRDVEDEATARWIEVMLDETIAAASPDDRVVVTAFPLASGLQLTVVAAHPTLMLAYEHWEADGAGEHRATSTLQQVGESDLLEIRFPSAPDQEVRAA